MVAIMVLPASLCGSVVAVYDTRRAHYQILNSYDAVRDPPVLDNTLQILSTTFLLSTHPAFSGNIFQMPSLVLLLQAGEITA